VPMRRVQVSCRQRPAGSAAGPTFMPTSKLGHGSDSVCITPGDVAGASFSLAARLLYAASFADFGTFLLAFTLTQAL
jgi:hypothetical protein